MRLSEAGFDECDDVADRFERAGAQVGVLDARTEALLDERGEHDETHRVDEPLADERSLGVERALGVHEQLRAAVASEAYEEAAAIRDRIREIEEGTA